MAQISIKHLSVGYNDMIDFVFPLITLSHGQDVYTLQFRLLISIILLVKYLFTSPRVKDVTFYFSVNVTEMRKGVYFFRIELQLSISIRELEQSFVHLLSQLTHFFDLYAIFISSHQTCHLYVPYSHECLKWHTSLLLFISYFYDRNKI